MMFSLFVFSGMVAGLITASSNGFKDTPWGEFILARFPRSIVWGGVRGFFRNRKPLHPEWLGAKRWVFFASYSLGVGMIIVFLFVSVHSG